MFPKRTPFGGVKKAQQPDMGNVTPQFQSAAAPAPIPNPEKKAQQDAEIKAREEQKKEHESLKKMRQAADKAVADSMNDKFNDKPDEVEFYPSIVPFRQFANTKQETSASKKTTKTEKNHQKK